MSRATWVNVGGAWKKVKNVWQNIGGMWKQKAMPKGNISGIWKNFINYMINWRLTVDTIETYASLPSYYRQVSSSIDKVIVMGEYTSDHGYPVILTIDINNGDKISSINMNSYGDSYKTIYPAYYYDTSKLMSDNMIYYICSYYNYYTSVIGINVITGEISTLKHNVLFSTVSSNNSYDNLKPYLNGNYLAISFHDGSSNWNLNNHFNIYNLIQNKYIQENSGDRIISVFQYNDYFICLQQDYYGSYYLSRTPDLSAYDWATYGTGTCYVNTKLSSTATSSYTVFGVDANKNLAFLYSANGTFISIDLSTFAIISTKTGLKTYNSMILRVNKSNSKVYIGDFSSNEIQVFDYKLNLITSIYTDTSSRTNLFDVDMNGITVALSSFALQRILLQ